MKLAIFLITVSWKTVAALDKTWNGFEHTLPYNFLCLIFFFTYCHIAKLQLLFSCCDEFWANWVICVAVSWNHSNDLKVTWVGDNNAVNMGLPNLPFSCLVVGTWCWWLVTAYMWDYEADIATISTICFYLFSTYRRQEALFPRCPLKSTRIRNLSDLKTSSSCYTDFLFSFPDLT